MPLFEQGEVSVYYELHGSGFPLLLLPPGGMGARLSLWRQAPFDPIEAFSDQFRVIAIDERNAGRSSGPIGGGDPWDAYLADHLALLDHLEVEQCHVLGCCIGVSHALKLLATAPQRVTTAVLEQPVGIVESNRQLFPNAFREWADALLAERPELDPSLVEAFGLRMWTGEFVLSVTRDDVAACRVPLLVLPGGDPAHPAAIAEEIASLAPNAQTHYPWKAPEHLPGTVSRVRSFLLEHRPASAAC